MLHRNETEAKSKTSTGQSKKLPKQHYVDGEGNQGGFQTDKEK
jgi:hypothetical protein